MAARKGLELIVASYCIDIDFHRGRIFPFLDVS
jgi:hypothetical protein